MTTPRVFRKLVEEPTMSDATLLIKVDDLINYAFGQDAANVVDMKTLHSIVQILACQMRVLEQDVEIRFDEEDDILVKIREAYGLKQEEDEKKGGEEEVSKGKNGKKGGKGARGRKGKEEEEEVEILTIGPKPGGKRVSETSVAKPGSSAGTTTQEEESKEGEEEGEKGAGSVTRIGSIEVVTPEQFLNLQKNVELLLLRTGGVPLPTLPSNEDLLAELAKGTASLTDTMEALQVCPRLLAAEKVISVMAEILTQLALSGALPPEVAATIAKIQDDMQQLALATESETADKGKGGELDFPSGTMKEVSATAALGAVASEVSKVGHEELQDVLDVMRPELIQNLEMLAAKSKVTVEQTNQTVKSVEETMDLARKMEIRINRLRSQTAKYLEQLSGFDGVMETQLTTFNEQMDQLRTNLDAGIARLESVNNNAEAQAMIVLSSGYENLLVDLEQASNAHGGVVTLQKNLNEELRGLANCIELIRDEKADRDEVVDGLRDKANKTRLKGLVGQSIFEKTRLKFENSMAQVLQKFTKLDQTWMGALKELKDISNGKTSFMTMLGLKDFGSQTINERYNMLHTLETILGDPKLATLTRKLSQNAYCGPCVSPALMEVQDKRSGAPPELPALRRRAPPDGRAEPRVATRAPDDTGKHICKRWVGGSHTLLTERASRERAATEQADVVPTKHFAGYGSDGRLYMLEEDLAPCRQCNTLLLDTFEDVQPASADGGGDIL